MNISQSGSLLIPNLRAEKKLMSNESNLKLLLKEADKIYEIYL